MDINFELYKIFFHAAKCESFSEAAEKLFISQSAVSQAIKNLETKIGEKLFLRKARSLKLTAEGQLLYKYVEQAYNQIKTAESRMAEIQNLSSGEVKIGVSDTICKYFLVPHIQKFINQHPKVKIQVLNRTSSQILSTLKNGLIDFGIVTLPVSDSTFTIQDFISVEDIFVASERFSSLKCKQVSPQQLAAYPLLTLDGNSSTRRCLDEFFKNNNTIAAPELELENIDLLVEFSRIGLGIAHVLKESAAEAIKKGELFKVKVYPEPPLRKLGIITHKNVPLSKASRTFISSLMDEKYTSYSFP